MATEQTFERLEAAIDKLSSEKVAMGKQTKIAGGSAVTLVLGAMGMIWSELGGIRDEITNLKIEASHHVVMERQILSLQDQLKDHEAADSHGRVGERLSLLEARLARLEGE